MKKVFPLILVFGLASCGQIKNPQSSSLGETLSFSQQAITGNDLTRLQTICAAVTSKLSRLTTTNNQTYTFGTSSKSCDASSLGATTSVVTQIEITGSSLKFRRVDNGGYFIMPEVETNLSGVLKSVCANVSNPVSPVLIDGGVAMWINRVPVATEDCNPAGNELCILIEKGLSGDNGATYQISSKDWIKFQVDSTRSNYGFWTGRKTISNSLCGTSKYSEDHADLK